MTEQWTVLVGDCREVMRAMPDASVDAVVCDPPYELGFMGKRWDASGIAYDVEVWRQCLRVLKPGGHLLAFGGTRTYHRMACAIEDAGFEIRDCIMWIYGSGFPKSLNVSKAIDRAAGVERTEVLRSYEIGGNAGVSCKDKGGTYGVGVGVAPAVKVDVTAPATEAAKQWDGWGTALKPAVEPIVVARKPLDGTVVGNVCKHGVGGINVDVCRIEGEKTPAPKRRGDSVPWYTTARAGTVGGDDAIGRWPANVVLSHAEGCAVDCVPGCPVAELDRQSGVSRSTGGEPASKGAQGPLGWKPSVGPTTGGLGDTGTASRFFYIAKASRAEREAGCDALPAVSGADAVDREEGSVGTRSPRAGAGRTADRVRNTHPTVKPVDLIKWLVRLVTPPGGLVLDPFAGSGSTGCACVSQEFRFVGIELEEPHAAIARARIAWWTEHPSGPTTESKAETEMEAQGQLTLMEAG